MSACKLFCHDVGMTWWQTLIIAIAPTLVTAGALLKQQQTASAREDHVRAEARSDVRRESLRAVHVDMLLALIALWRPVEPCFRNLPTQGETASLPADTVIPTVDRTNVDAARVALALAASDNEIARADEAIAAVLTTYSLLRQVVDGQGNGSISPSLVRRHRKGTDEAIRKYERTARDALEALHKGQAVTPVNRRRRRGIPSAG